jgi:hypothetical protein
MVGLIIYCGSQKIANPTIFNGVRINDYIHYSGFVAGIKNNLLNNNFVSYPNPFNNELTVVSATNRNITSIEIVNIIGEKTNLEFQKSNFIFKTNTEKLTNGVYFLKIMFDDNQTSVIKVIKQ